MSGFFFFHDKYSVSFLSIMHKTPGKARTGHFREFAICSMQNQSGLFSVCQRLNQLNQSHNRKECSRNDPGLCIAVGMHHFKQQ